MDVQRAILSDCQEILSLQKLAYISEAEIYDDFEIAPLVQTLHEIEDEFCKKVFLKVVLYGKIIGSVRGFTEKGTCYIEKLIVHPNFQNYGLGTLLLKELEKVFSDCERYELFTGHRSQKNLRLYTKLGYKEFKILWVTSNLAFVFLEKEAQIT